jgi:hypothetical protein
MLRLKILSLLLFLGFYAKAQVSGKAQFDLKGLPNHAGIMVTFWDEFTFDCKDTAFTNEEGYFELDLLPGNYYVFYEANGFQQYRNPEAFVHKGKTELGIIKLTPILIENNRKKWNPYGDKCVCNKPKHHGGTMPLPSFGGN